MGNDGCKGSQKLLATNKIVIVQDPETCLAEDMRNTVIDQGSVSYVLTLSEIASYLKGWKIFLFYSKITCYIMKKT